MRGELSRGRIWYSDNRYLLTAAGRAKLNGGLGAAETRLPSARSS